MVYCILLLSLFCVCIIDYLLFKSNFSYLNINSLIHIQHRISYPTHWIFYPTLQMSSFRFPVCDSEPKFLLFQICKDVSLIQYPYPYSIPPFLPFHSLPLSYLFTSLSAHNEFQTCYSWLSNQRAPPPEYQGIL